MTEEQTSLKANHLKLYPRLVPRDPVADKVLGAVWLRGRTPDELMHWLCQQASHGEMTLADWNVFQLVDEGQWIVIRNDDIEGGVTAKGTRELGLYRPIDRLNLWVPVSAKLEPNVKSLSSLWSEAANGCDGHHSVWLPHRDPIALEPDDRIDLLSWMKRPSIRSESWSAPNEVQPLVRRIASLRIERTVELREFVDDRDDPNTGKTDWKDILADEPGGLGSTIRQWMLKKADNWSEKQSRKTVQNTSSAAGSSSGPNAMDRLMKSLMSSSLASQRNKAMEKWFKMAESDPTRAIRMALPMTGGSTGFRGIALPGAKLMDRMMSFGSIGMGQGSGGPTDFWDLESSMSYRLIEKYREMAQNAIAAGAYKRAAYIYAELVGDYSSAADALAAGRHFHLAALMYRDRLNNRKRAAECFASAGMIEDAIALHQAGNHFLDIADLYQRIGDTVNENLWIEREVERRVENHQLVMASELIIDRLNDCDRAEQLLSSQWPGGRQVVPCAQRLLVIWKDKHQKVIHWLRSAMMDIDETSPTHVINMISEILHAGMDRRQHPEVQAFSHDSVAVLMATHHDRLSKRSVHRLASLVRMRDAQDGVLSRNVFAFQRSLGSEAVTTRSKKAIVDRSQSKSLHMLGRYQLPQATYQDAWSEDGDVLLLSVNGDKFLVNRWALDRVQFHAPLMDAETKIVKTHAKSWTSSRIYTDHLAMYSGLTAEIIPFRDGKSSRGFAIRWLAVDESQSLISIDQCVLDPELSRGVPWRIEDAIPSALRFASAVVHHAVSGWIGLFERETGYELATVASDGTLRVRLIPQLREASEMALLLVLEDQVVVAASDIVVVGVLKASRQREVELGGVVNRLAASPPRTRKRLAVCHEDGLDLLWPTIDSIDHLRVETGVPFNDAVWSAGGRLFALSGSHLHKYMVNGQRLVAAGAIELQGGDPIRLLATDSQACCVIHRSGLVERFA
ncbi:MAG: hypothetical protein AAF664_18260 [Planctomycetota bacterium]